MHSPRQRANCVGLSAVCVRPGGSRLLGMAPLERSLSDGTEIFLPSAAAAIYTIPLNSFSLFLSLSIFPTFILFISSYVCFCNNTLDVRTQGLAKNGDPLRMHFFSSLQIAITAWLMGVDLGRKALWLSGGVITLGAIHIPEIINTHTM